MDLQTIETLGKIAAPAGIAIGAFLYIGRDIIAKRIFPQLTREHAFKLIRAIALMAWTIALAGIAAWTFIASRPRELPPDNSIEEYNDDWIPLVYQDVHEFRMFLERNSGKRVKINSAIALDIVLPENQLVHLLCEMDWPERSETAEPKAHYSFEMPEFSDDFDSSELSDLRYNSQLGGLDFPESVLAKVTCRDTLRIELLDPTSLRWSYGGTGTQSLPLSGTFKITRRFFSGPRTEYTLRQIEE